MSEDKTGLPRVQIVVYLGHPDGAPSREIEGRSQRAKKTFDSFYLLTGKSITNKWDVSGVERFFIVRESQKHIYSSQRIETNGFSQIVMPDKSGFAASNRREWVRTNVPLQLGTVRIQVDADFQNIGLSLMAIDPWFDKSVDVSEFIGTWILQFQRDAKYKGVSFAGFNDRGRRPGIIPHLYPGHDMPGQYGLSYFKENLTFETSECPGKYPKDWNYKEGAWRILDINRKGGKSVRYFPTARFITRKSEVYEAPEADNAYIDALIQEFKNRDLVLQSRGRGLGLGRYGLRRNYIREEVK